MQELDDSEIPSRLLRALRRRLGASALDWAERPQRGVTVDLPRADPRGLTRSRNRRNGCRMIERVHLLKLKAEHATFAGRREVVERALAVLPAVPGVRGVTAGAPADPDSEKSWDVFIVVRFASMADIEPYRTHAEHRRFVDEFLAPRLEVKKGWNFDCLEPAWPRAGGKLRLR